MHSGQENPIGSSWQFLSGLMLTAFSFEAYLNHVGPESILCWEELEKLSPMAKLKVLCERLAIPMPAAGKRPLDTVQKLFDFRNAIAHGRTAEVKCKPAVRHQNNYEEELNARALSAWERDIQDDKFLLRAREDAEAVMRLLQASRLGATDNLFTSGAGWSAATLLGD